MAIPVFQPEDNPTRANFNARIEAANAALEEKQDKLTGSAGQVVGFDAAGNPVAQSTANLVGPSGPQGPAGEGDGKSAYQYAVDGGYTGTEAEFAALMGSGPWLPISGGTMTGALSVLTPTEDVHAANKQYVDSLIKQFRADMVKSMEKIACLVIGDHGDEQRINVKLTPFLGIRDYDYQLSYSGVIPLSSNGSVTLEPPPGYAFTGLAATWLPALKVGMEYRYGTLNADGSITFGIYQMDIGSDFTFVSSYSYEAPARFILEVA